MSKNNGAETVCVRTELNAVVLVVISYFQRKPLQFYCVLLLLLL